MNDPIVGRGKKRNQAGVVPVHNKISDGKIHRSLLGPRQVGAVPHHQDPRHNARRPDRETTKMDREQQAAASLNTLRYGDDPARHVTSADILSSSPYKKVSGLLMVASRLATLAGLVYAWTLVYNQLVIHMLPPNAYFDLLQQSFWTLTWSYLTKGYATNMVFIKTMLLPVVGWFLSSILVLIFGVKFFLPLLSFISRPFLWVMRNLFGGSGWLSDVMKWRGKVNKPRRAGTGFSDEHEPEQVFMDEDPQAAFRDAAMVRRQQEEEEKEENPDDEEGFSGGGGSVPSGGQSPNAIAAAMSGRSGNSV